MTIRQAVNNETGEVVTFRDAVNNETGETEWLRYDVPEPEVSEIDSIIAEGDAYLANKDAPQRPAARERPRDYTSDVGIGVDKGQQDLYSLAEFIGEKTGIESVEEFGREGVQRQTDEMATKYGYNEGDETSLVTDIVRAGPSLAAGTAAVPLALAGSIPTAIASAGMLGTSAAMNVGKAANEAEPDASTGDVLMRGALNTAIDVAPLPALKAVKATGKVAGKVAKHTAPGKAVARWKDADVRRDVVTLMKNKKFPKKARRNQITDKMNDGLRQNKTEREIIDQIGDLSQDETTYLSMLYGLKESGKLVGDVSHNKLIAAMRKESLKNIASGVAEDALTKPIRTGLEASFWAGALGL